MTVNPTSPFTNPLSSSGNKEKELFHDGSQMDCILHAIAEVPVKATISRLLADGGGKNLKTK